MLNNFRDDDYLWQKTFSSWKAAFLCVCLVRAGRRSTRKEIFYALGICRAGGNILCRNSMAASKTNLFWSPISLFFSDRRRQIRNIRSLARRLVFTANKKEKLDSSNKWAILVNIKQCEKSSFPLRSFSEIDKSTSTSPLSRISVASRFIIWLFASPTLNNNFFWISYFHVMTVKSSLAEETRCSTTTLVTFHKNHDAWLPHPGIEYILPRKLFLFAVLWNEHW